MKDRIEEKISKRLYELTLDDIRSLNHMEQGGSVSNLLNGLEEEAYSLIVKEKDFEEKKLRYSLVYIGYKQGQVIGYLLEDIDVFDKDRDDITLGFSIFLEQQFLLCDRIDVYNTFQSHLRSALEKLDYFTYTQDLINKSDNKNATILLKFKNGIVFVPIVNKIDAYRDLFKRTNKQVKNKKEELIDFVYLFFNDRNKLTKIGTSKKPDFREKTLQGEEPVIEVIAKWKAPKKMERELHKIFKEKRVRGEWFKLNTKDYTYIGEYTAKYNLSE